MGKFSQEISFAEKLQAEFGMPDFKINPYGKGKTYTQGAECPSNPACRLVNTPRCDILKCFSAVRKSKAAYGGMIED